MVCLLGILLIGGCQTFNADQSVYSKYYETTLNYSTSAEVLEYIQNPLTEYLSQSNSVVASWNQIDKGKTSWFNMVAFDQDTLKAVRKYGFSAVEQHLYPNATPRLKMRFDAEMIIDGDVLNGVYPNKNDYLIAVLKASFAKFKADSQEVTADSTVLNSCSMMVNQAMNAVLVKLASSPSYAVRLPWLEGMEFNHPTLGESRIRVLILDNVVKIKIKASPAWFKNIPFEQQSDVMYM